MSETIKIPNFYEFLNQNHLDISKMSDDEKDIQRKKYVKFRNNLYKKRSRQKHIVCELKLDNYEARFFREKAKEHKLLLSYFIKLSAKNYCEQKFLFPDRAGFQILIKSIQKIEDTIQKIEKQKTSKFSLTDSKYELIYNHIQEMKFKVFQGLLNPVNTNAWLDNEFNTNPDFRKQIINKLLNYL